MNRDTIVALSTPPGMGALAVIRLSGSQAVSIAQKIFPDDLSKLKSHHAKHGWIVVHGEKIDEVMLTKMLAPRSFTGEDTVEITCHGSVYIQQRIISEVLNAGGRMANAGEFSMRAFLNGRIDLSQAEAIGDLIASESSAAHRQALHQMRGGFSTEIRILRDKLIHFASMIELELDFSEEDVEFADRRQLTTLIEEIQLVVGRLIQSFSLGNAIKNGVPVAILGAPNMGKSTLLNALLNEERAIVSDIPGTTRDTVEDTIVIGGIKFRFIDTAGLRETQDVIEKLGIDRSMASARDAAIILLLFDPSETSLSELQTRVNAVASHQFQKSHPSHSLSPVLLIANKIDKMQTDLNQKKIQFSGLDNILWISAKNKTGIDELKKQLLELVESGQPQSETIVTNARHHHALSQASASLNQVSEGIITGVPGDLLAVDIRRALYHLGEITGEISSDDLLHNIFSSFCIGK